MTIPRLMTRPGECGWGSLGNLLGEYELVRISELPDPCCEWFRDVDSPPAWAAQEGREALGLPHTAASCVSMHLS